MAKAKHKVSQKLAEKALEIVAPVEVQPELEPVKEVLQEICKDCRYWHRQMTSQYGLCKRRVLTVLQGSSLTEFGPLGRFAVMPEHETCGEYVCK